MSAPTPATCYVEPSSTVRICRSSCYGNILRRLGSQRCIEWAPSGIALFSFRNGSSRQPNTLPPFFVLPALHCIWRLKASRKDTTLFNTIDMLQQLSTTFTGRVLCPVLQESIKESNPKEEHVGDDPQDGGRPTNARYYIIVMA